MHALNALPLLQADPALADQLRTIVWAQVTMAVVMVLCALAILGAALAVLLLARRAMKAIEDTSDQLMPRLDPLLGHATSIADDVREVTAGAREDAEAARELVRDLLGRSRRAADSVEERVRRLGLVVEVVQEEAEVLLMDTAATARGISATARALREEREDAPRSPRGPDTHTHSDGHGRHEE